MGTVVLRNRLMMTPHLGRLDPTAFLRYLDERMVGGPGLVVTPAGQPVYGATTYPPPVGGDDGAAWRAAVPFLTRQAEIVHAHGAVLVGQIHHPGAERSWDGFDPPVAPSAVPAEGPAQMPHALAADEIDQLLERYVRNAAWIMEAGFDGVEVHAAHGYLLNRFLSPAYNRRRDRFGGTGGWSLLAELLGRVRRVVGPAALLGVRLPAYEEVPGGLTVDQVADGAATCAASLDFVDLSFGNHDGRIGGRPATAYTTPWLWPRPDLLPACGAVRAATGLPVALTGGIVSAGQVEAALASGQADLVGIARAAIADPRFAAKVLAGHGDRVAECIGCNECVLVPFSCPVNPAAGREAELDPVPASRAGGLDPGPTARAGGRPRVLVIGGGPAGLTAGLAMADRGHAVTVVERQALLGGALRSIVADPARARWGGLLDRLVGSAGDRVDVRAGTAADAATVAAVDPDLVVVATGSRPRGPSFAADGSVDVFSSVDLLAGRRPAADGTTVVVAGDEPHLDPLLAARLLAAEGRSVRLVVAAAAPGTGVEPRTLGAVLRSLYAGGVAITCGVDVAAVDGGTVWLERLFGGPPEGVPAAAVVLAHGRLADDLADRLGPGGPPRYVIGDALAPRRLAHAVLEGARFGARLVA
ncbi:MAG TPA: FAD-dependent oxidoreductase [Acidimicrobiales bacterium]|nr:FAD-dependent oxidoreductase [Acidimicrobiales bacterium]